MIRRPLTVVIACAALAVSGCSAQTTLPSTGGSGLIVGNLTGPVPPQYVDLINAAGKTCTEISAPLIAAQLQAESGFDPNAVSAVGAQGIAQFMPSTWPTWGGSGSPFDPTAAIPAQARYMCSLAAAVSKDIAAGTVHGTVVELALAAYNAGLGAVESAGGIPNITETQGYVQQIIRSATQQFGGSWSDPAQGDGGGTWASIIAILRSKLGTPYSWGGGTVTGPTYGTDQGAGTIGWDCSSFMQYGIYQGTGGKITLPRTTEAQVAAYPQYLVHDGSMQPGDLVYFGVPADHVVMYIGNGQIIQEPHSGEVADIQPLSYEGTPSYVIRLPLEQMEKQA